MTTGECAWMLIDRKSAIDGLVWTNELKIRLSVSRFRTTKRFVPLHRFGHAPCLYMIAAHALIASSHTVHSCVLYIICVFCVYFCHVIKMLLNRPIDLLFDSTLKMTKHSPPTNSTFFLHLQTLHRTGTPSPCRLHLSTISLSPNLQTFHPQIPKIQKYKPPKPAQRSKTPIHSIQ